MAHFSYNISSKLKENLSRIDEIRARILLTPIPPKTELRLRFDATIKRVQTALALTNTAITQEEVRRLLVRQFRPKQPRTRRLSRQQQGAISYKQALDYVFWHWFVSSAKVSVKTATELYEQATGGKLRVSESELNRLLKYLQPAEHPVVQAGIVYQQCAQLVPTQEGRRLAMLLALLYFLRQGWDVRGLLAVEEILVHDQSSLAHALEQARSGNLTLWLECFAQMTLAHLAATLDSLSKATNLAHTQREAYLSAAFFTLNERQKAVLAHLEQGEGVSITNRNVQKLFGVSQITASRDLARLATLELLFAHGKGRSVYYTRV